ncbi:MAG: ribosome-associated translation inhibitor RaiA [Spirulina sp. SIO3F2]|nr:ribosome-associated translation inhibitor RaiA [Spirulina sp. SIO3F2]
MKLLIQGNNIEVTESIHNYVQQKLAKAVKHFQHITTTVDVHLSVARNPRISKSHQAEVTVHANGTVIRAQELSEDLYASIDLVADKITRQLRKYKEKHLHKTHTQAKTGLRPEEQLVEQDLIGDREPALPGEVVRMKYFTMPPMSIEEALLQLELVDHDFFVFQNRDTGEINVMYHRNHGGVGVIAPHPAHPNNGHQNGNGLHTNHLNGHSKAKPLEPVVRSLS